jgi:GNAT superfamily N-acetyltransferase
MFCVKQIEYSDIDEYVSMLVERCNWLKDHNIDMWKIEQLNKESIIQKYESPMCFLAYEDSVSVGGFLLLEKDNRYWPEKTEDKAYYFHKFVVRPDFGGKGYSKKILNWVKEFGKLNGKNYIRLDYETRRKYLRKMYLNSGFVDVEYMNQNKGFEIVKAEYKL